MVYDGSRQYTSATASSCDIDPDLRLVIEAWAMLPPQVRVGIVAMVNEIGPPDTTNTAATRPHDPPASHRPGSKLDLPQA